jgi:hypothetical protein
MKHRMLVIGSLTGLMALATPDAGAQALPALTSTPAAGGGTTGRCRSRRCCS